MSDLNPISPANTVQGAAVTSGQNGQKDPTQPSLGLPDSHRQSKNQASQEGRKGAQALKEKASETSVFKKIGAGLGFVFGGIFSLVFGAVSLGVGFVGGILGCLALEPKKGAEIGFMVSQKYLTISLGHLSFELFKWSKQELTEQKASVLTPKTSEESTEEPPEYSLTPEDEAWLNQTPPDFSCTRHDGQNNQDSVSGPPQEPPTRMIKKNQSSDLLFAFEEDLDNEEDQEKSEANAPPIQQAPAPPTPPPIIQNVLELPPQVEVVEPRKLEEDLTAEKLRPLTTILRGSKDPLLLFGNSNYMLSPTKTIAAALLGLTPANFQYKLNDDFKKVGDSSPLPTKDELAKETEQLSQITEIKFTFTPSTDNHSPDKLEINIPEKLQQQVETTLAKIPEECFTKTTNGNDIRLTISTDQLELLIGTLFPNYRNLSANYNVLYYLKKLMYD
jgi:hypothetical protein